MFNKKPFIVFEGIEGSGKSYHSKKIINYLKKNKIPYIYIREPGGSKNAEVIRKLILTTKNKTFDAVSHNFWVPTLCNHKTIWVNFPFKSLQ